MALEVRVQGIYENRDECGLCFVHCFLWKRCQTINLTRSSAWIGTEVRYSHCKPQQLFLLIKHGFFFPTALSSAPSFDGGLQAENDVPKYRGRTSKQN